MREVVSRLSTEPSEVELKKLLHIGGLTNEAASLVIAECYSKLYRMDMKTASNFKKMTKFILETEDIIHANAVYAFIMWKGNLSVNREFEAKIAMLGWQHNNMSSRQLFQALTTIHSTYKT
ncbi:hypothetical protein DASC09_017000 [Saccharomycopsis crataegensis]|uniref:Uncharacterized protein n=1 Tax=Saccharomycopsis crataegensis TaxID=43959 RepID=A0AAV5QHG1_9ASCO|nr:hypothetical protein DASC09_017000 [Saccharomycopsis crataegensis]